MELLPTIPLSKDFLAFLKMDEAQVYALKPVFAARCEKFASTNRYLERAVMITQEGQLILLALASDKRITHRVELGANRPHKKLIVQVDRHPNSKDGKQTVRILTEPVTPLDDASKPRWNRFDTNETEEEFNQRMHEEAEKRGEFLPDLDLVLCFHCRRAPIAAQFVSIVKHFALPVGDFFVELEDISILQQVKDERPLVSVIKNIFQRKESKKAPVSLKEVAQVKHEEVVHAGEEIYVPPPVQPPRLGGTKKDLTAVEDLRFGVTPKHVEIEQRKARATARAKTVAQKQADQAQDEEDDDDEDDDRVARKYYSQYRFDEPDPEDMEARRVRLSKPPRKPLDEISINDEEEEEDEEDAEDSDAEAKRKLKSQKKKVKEDKKAKKDRQKAAKKRKEAEEAERKKQTKEALTQAQLQREQEREDAGYRYGPDFLDEETEGQPEQLYRTKSSSKPNALYVIRAPREEESLALTSLCFYRRNAIALLNPAMQPDDQETVSIAVSSSGQFLICTPAEDEIQPELQYGATSGRGFPMSSIVRCRIDFSNHFCNGIRSGYITLYIDLNAKKNKKKRKKKLQARVLEDGEIIEPEDERYALYFPEDMIDEDIRTVELDLDDISCGEMNSMDAECCDLEYFANVVIKKFSPEAEIELRDPPIEVPQVFVPRMPEETPVGAMMAERMVSSAANRAIASQCSTADFQAPIHHVDEETHQRLLHKAMSMSTSLSVNPEAIKRRGDQLRKIIEDHKRTVSQKGGGGAHHSSARAATSTSLLFEAPTEEEAELTKLQHRALTQLLFQITERRLQAIANEQTGKRYSSVMMRGGVPLTFADISRSDSLLR